MTRGGREPDSSLAADPQAVIRPGTKDELQAIAQVHVAAWKTTYRGIIPDAVLNGLSVDRRKTLWRRYVEEGSRPWPSRFLLVAERADGRIMGFAAAGPDRSEAPEYDAELHAIYLLQDARGMGVGRSLMSSVASRLEQAGCVTMTAWVLAANPARGFYDRLGGVEVGRKRVRIGGRPMNEVAVAWTSLETLIRDELS